MDALSPPADPVGVQVTAAQAALARAAERAGFRGDPVGEAFEALSLSLGAQLALHRGLHAQLDTHAAAALDQATVKLVDDLAPPLLHLTQRWHNTLTWRARVTCGVLAAGLTIVAGLAGYGLGWNDGLVRGDRDGGIIAGIVNADGPDAETALVHLMRNNDLAAVLARCQQTSVNEDGGRACAAPLWLDPPTPRAP